MSKKGLILNLRLAPLLAAIVWKRVMAFEGWSHEQTDWLIQTTPCFWHFHGYHHCHHQYFLWMATPLLLLAQAMRTLPFLMMQTMVAMMLMMMRRAAKAAAAAVDAGVGFSHLISCQYFGCYYCCCYYHYYCCCCCCCYYVSWRDFLQRYRVDDGTGYL